MPRQTTDLAVVVLAAGLGTRMKSDRPKVLHAVAGRPMIGHVLAAVAPLKPSRVVLVVGPEPAMAAVEKAARAAAPSLAVTSVVQAERLGTGHAVKQTKAALAGHRGDVVIVFGDTPLVTTESLRRLVQARRRARHAVVAAAFRPGDRKLFARLVLDARGRLERIVEARDATPAELAIELCNAGFITVDGALLFDLLGRVRNDNVKREYYLFDIIRLAAQRERSSGFVEIPVADAFGVDSRAALAEAEAMCQARLRRAALDGGATLVAPETVFFSAETKLGRDVIVGPHVVFGPGCTIGDGVEIRGFSHLEGCTIAPGATVGPFARLRPGAAIGEDAHVGNFVEIKAARVERGAKVNHLTYIGDARIGAKANVGAGTITCNYDGFEKFHTDIGEGAFIGSNTALVAPVRIGDGANVGA
ncbi:MAG: bifunctional UDP-N-acetylglucosamine diphosphorylase/glucosamine-1-phosphate N-acetyltransferase GlmU, partial [Alphaproteobacteria bacterium]|nr:bifunctional UDP-N-acetylglucosamine diphosphorylase/glucosamine-1-phosphate N-acetyltransferase GlmU [Alphaproteobacteria bacterium]